MVTDYTNRCYTANTSGFDSSATITYDSITDCTQTCISYTDLSAASEGSASADGSSEEVSGTVAIGGVCTMSSECIKSTDSVCCGSYDVEDLTEPSTYSVEETTYSTTYSVSYSYSSVEPVWNCVNDETAESQSTSLYRYTRTCDADDSVLVQFTAFALALLAAVSLF